MKKQILLAIIFLGLFALTGNSKAADVYVAPATASPAGNDANAGTIDAPKLTIQAGINALKVQGPGNTLYLRGGNYTELPTDGTVRGFSYATLNNATSWDNSYTISSYPGEWAVIDAAAYTADARVFVFYTEQSTSEVGMIGFIEFSRLEIKNAHGTTHTAAIAGTGGPFKFRYLSIHDNICDTSSNNPGGIRLGNGSGDVLVEYSYFKGNGHPGGTENCGQVVIFSDYKYDAGEWSSIALHNGSGFSTARHNNIIRYNYFDGTTNTANVPVGYFEKAAQFLADEDYDSVPDDTNSWSDEGNKIHHNIFVNHYVSSAMVMTDYDQVYNNIADSTVSNRAGFRIGINPTNNFRNPTQGACAYNNTILGGTRGALDFTESMYTTFSSSTFFMQWWAYNNIFDAPTDGDSNQDLSIAKHYNGTYTWDSNSLLRASNNYFYRPANTTLCRYITTDMTLATLNATAWAENNRSHAHSDLDSLYAGTTGANKYKLNSSYSDYSSVSSGGIGGNHPYLSGVAIPSYIGAVNPNDDDWVQGVMGLATVSNLQSGSGDPAWIEDETPAEEDITPPASPSGLSVS